MRVALLAQHFGALHEEAVVGLGVDIFWCGGRGEAGPSGAGIELFSGAEERRAATRATVYAGFVIVPVTAGEGRFSSLLARNGELIGRQLFAPFGVRLDDLVHFDGPFQLAAVGEQGDRDGRSVAVTRGVGQRTLATGHHPQRHPSAEDERHEDERAARNAFHRFMVTRTGPLTNFSRSHDRPGRPFLQERPRRAVPRRSREVQRSG